MSGYLYVRTPPPSVAANMTLDPDSRDSCVRFTPPVSISLLMDVPLPWGVAWNGRRVQEGELLQATGCNAAGSCTQGMPQQLRLAW